MNKVLIIEDDLMLMDSIGDFLAEEGFEVVQAADGKEGVEKAIEHLPSLILCDIIMPKWNGYEVFDKLKNEVSTSLIPFIFLTARDDKEDILYAMKMGVDDYITKPLDLDELLSRITNRLKKNNETIRRSEIKYRAVFETAHDAILLIRVSDLRILDVNQAACTLLGFCRSEMLEDSGYHFIKALRHQELPDRQGVGKPCFQDFQHRETRWENKQGEQILVQVSGKLITLFSEEILLIVARDITDRKKYEEQLILAKEKAEESDRLKSSILSNISHELRTPLNGILGFSELLLEDLRETEYLPMVENIHVSGKRLMTTLNSIITLSQLQAGKVTLVFNHIDVAAVILPITKMYQDQIREKQITLHLELPGDKIIVYTDLILFKQLFTQILDNAVKFTPEGTVTIRSGQEKKDGLPWETIQVIDTGIGIEPKYLEMIFHEFRQVSEGYNRKFQGSGLGLSICNKIAGLLKGRITVESVPGEGTTFTIWLPAITGTQSPVPEQEESPVPEVPLTPGKRSKNPLLLLVEDNLINKSLMERFLEPGYRMDHAMDGKTAVKMAELTRYDAILMDINLGTGMDGIQATQKIKALPGYEHIPVIAVTGYTMMGDRERLLAQGCTHYIAKPFEKSALLAVIKEALSGEQKPT